jgi:phosphate transport system protein
MGGMVEHQFLDAMRPHRQPACDRVMKDDDAVNRLEVDDACSHLIVRRQPTANDLRTIMATIKVITDLERVGDEATKIARTAKHLHKRGIGLVSHYEMVRGSPTGQDQLRALDAFARLDDKQAAELIKQDAASTTASAPSCAT